MGLLHVHEYFCLQYFTKSEELKVDTRHLFQLLERDPEHVHLNHLDHYKVAGLVDEALNILYHDNQLDEPVRVYSDSCMVISLFFHFLVMTLCKRLMQLIVAEALPAIQNCIPIYYIEHYLIFQHHFSLKCLIANQLNNIGQNNGQV